VDTMTSLRCGWLLLMRLPRWAGRLARRGGLGFLTGAERPEKFEANPRYHSWLPGKAIAVDCAGAMNGDSAPTILKHGGSFESRRVQGNERSKRQELPTAP
jgi:hypothetical protein